MVQTVILMFATLYILANLIADILYAYLDPASATPEGELNLGDYGLNRVLALWWSYLWALSYMRTHRFIPAAE